MVRILIPSFAKKFKMAAEMDGRMSCLELCSVRFEEVFVQNV